MSNFGTIKEWEQAFRELAVNSAEGFLSANELCEQMRLGRAALLRRLKALRNAGRLETCTKHAIDIAGRSQSVPAYRIKEES